MHNSSVAIPKYQQIAVEVASRIASGDIAEGTRLSGRTSIAGQYKVSPETARKAFSILSDLGIVSSEKGSGMHIRSRQKAAAFLERFEKQQTIETIRDDIYRSLNRQKTEMAHLHEALAHLIMATEHYRSMNPLMPLAIHITSQCRFIGQTIQEMRFWQNTGATIVAIKRDEALIVSPGPLATIMENDEIYFVAQGFNDQRIRAFLFPEDGEK